MQTHTLNASVPRSVEQHFVGVCQCARVSAFSPAAGKRERRREIFKRPRAHALTIVDKYHTLRTGRHNCASDAPPKHAPSHSTFTGKYEPA
jgi:hypothetical protein